MVTPICIKKENQESVENYWPITVSTVLWKVFKSCIYKKCCLFLTSIILLLKTNRVFFLVGQLKLRIIRSDKNYGVILLFQCNQIGNFAGFINHFFVVREYLYIAVKPTGGAEANTCSFRGTFTTAVVWRKVKAMKRPMRIWLT